jgi:hypothetical protein
MRIHPALIAALLCAATHSQAAGTYFRTLSADVPLPVSNSNTILLSVTVPAGVYRIEGVVNHINLYAGIEDNLYCNISAGSAGVSSSSETDASDYRNLVIQGAVKLPATTTITLGCRQGGTPADVLIKATSTSLIVVTTPALK